MKLWLVRHAQPLVEAGVCYGASDLPADAQATQACACALAELLPPGLRVLTSPLQRCTQLAQALQALRPDLPATPDARLREMDFGCWEGVRWDAIPKTAYDAWTSAFGQHRFGGRESVQELMQRVAAAQVEAVQGGGDVAWITHAGVMRAMRLLAQGIARIEHAAQWPQEAPAWGQWQLLEAFPLAPLGRGLG
jgi:alpha-ribazole phosphatase